MLYPVGRIIVECDESGNVLNVFRDPDHTRYLTLEERMQEERRVHSKKPPE